MLCIPLPGDSDLTSQGLSSHMSIIICKHLILRYTLPCVVKQNIKFQSFIIHLYKALPSIQQRCNCSNSFQSLLSSTTMAFFPTPSSPIFIPPSLVLTGLVLSYATPELYMTSPSATSPFITPFSSHPPHLPLLLPSHEVDTTTVVPSPWAERLL